MLDGGQSFFALREISYLFSLENTCKMSRKLYVPLAVLGLTTGATWATDHYYFASTLERNLRTLITGLRVTYEYKINFTVSSYSFDFNFVVVGLTKLCFYIKARKFRKGSQERFYLWIKNNVFS